MVGRCGRRGREVGREVGGAADGGEAWEGREGEIERGEGEVRLEEDGVRGFRILIYSHTLISYWAYMGFHCARSINRDGPLIVVNIFLVVFLQKP